jgi:hypothetical protein
VTNHGRSVASMNRNRHSGGSEGLGSTGMGTVVAVARDALRWTRQGAVIPGWPRRTPTRFG